MEWIDVTCMFRRHFDRGRANRKALQCASLCVDRGPAPSLPQTSRQHARGVQLSEPRHLFCELRTRIRQHRHICIHIRVYVFVTNLACMIVPVCMHAGLDFHLCDDGADVRKVESRRQDFESCGRRLVAAFVRGGLAAHWGSYRVCFQRAGISFGRKHAVLLLSLPSLP